MEEKKEVKKQRPNFSDKYKGSKERTVSVKLVDQNGKETKIKI